MSTLTKLSHFSLTTELRLRECTNVQAIVNAE